MTRNLKLPYNENCIYVEKGSDNSKLMMCSAALSYWEIYSNYRKW